MHNVTALVESWSRELTQALEMMTGQSFRSSPPVSLERPGATSLWWVQSLSVAGASIAVGAASEVWNELGTRALLGAGIESVEEQEAQSTWFEIVQQSISGALRTIAGSGAPLESREGRGGECPRGGRAWGVDIGTPDGMQLRIEVVLSDPLLTTLGCGPTPDRTASAPAAVQPASRTMEVLLDVQLPVSISFGSAQMPLRDVLKLSAGSVVELDRQPEEPVDIVVNDYVIARGEVVVVDGNYAVRIQEIVSRQQRVDASHINRAGGRS